MRALFFRICFAIFVFYTTTFCVADPTSQDSAPKAPTKYAVLVGVNDYARLVKLRYAKNDIEALRDELYKIGFEKENVYCLTCGGETKNLPTKENIEIVVESVFGMARDGDIVVIAMNGHGIETDGQARFCPQDTKEGSLLATTIPIGDIFAAFARSKATFKLMLVDACRENPFASRSVAGASALQTLADPPKGIMLLQSCAKGELSYEDPNLKRGVFTHHLVEGLQGKAADKEGKVTLLGLATYTIEKTQRWTLNQFRAKQRPYLKGEITDFTLAEDAIEWLREAVKADYREYVVCDQGKKRAFFEEKHRTRLPVWKEAAERDIPEGEFLYATCFELGIGVSKDFAEAARWYRKAAEQGLAPAQTSLGFCYFFGQGVSEDRGEALRWYRKAAEQGHARAQYNLGVRGENSEKSHDTEPTKLSERKFLLRSNRKTGTIDLVELLLETNGEAKQDGKNGRIITEKMDVTGGFRYEERITEFANDPTGTLACIRKYNLAKTKTKIGNKVTIAGLDENRRMITCSVDSNKVSFFSSHGSLQGEHLRLINMPCNTLMLDRLLPNVEVKIADTWKIDDNVLQSLLPIDAVTESNVEAVLMTVDDNMAMIEINGDVNGIHRESTSTMSMKARCQFDLVAKRITWIGIMLEENRSVGLVEPGMDVVTKVQVKILPVIDPPSSTDDFPNSADHEANGTIVKMKYDDYKGPWRFSPDRDWHVFQDDPQTTVLRRLHHGDMVAQCNIADRGMVDVQTMETLDKFAQILQTNLGDNSGKIVSTEERTNSAGYKVYTVLIDGVVEDMQLRWIYHLLTDSEGRQVIVVFIVDTKMLEQFDDADEILLNTFRLGK